MDQKTHEYWYRGNSGEEWVGPFASYAAMKQALQLSGLISAEMECRIIPGVVIAPQKDEAIEN